MVSVASNVLRGVITFFTGLLIARGLSPVGYGDLMFLLGSFVAIRSLLDMGSSSAFYTFLSQITRGKHFFIVYFIWLALQFFLTLALVSFIIPSGVFTKIWLGHHRGIVLLAFVAAFMQQQVWQMVGQIGESMRLTVKVQLMNLVVAVAYLVSISLFLYYHLLTVDKVLMLIIGQYLLATLVACYFLKYTHILVITSQVPYKKIISEYIAYCKPLAVLAVFGFIYAFADNWMLQSYSGASQQGFFQIASQFASVSLLATTSILNIFWKEIAHAHANDNHERMAYLYKKVTRGLVILGAIFTGALIPWSEQIVSVLLGSAYSQAWPALTIMLLYPIHQSMGQIGGIMLLATSRTQKYTMMSIALSVLSIPCTYFVLAPTSSTFFPGLGLGAMGLAIKMVLVGIISVNIQAWVIAKYSGWKFDYLFQVVGIPLMISSGYFAKLFADFVCGISRAQNNVSVVAVIIMLIAYIVMVVSLIWVLPWLISIDRNELNLFIGKLTKRIS